MMDAKTMTNLVACLRSSLGSDGVVESGGSSPVAYPRTEEEAAEAVRIAVDHRVSVWPAGAGTYLGALVQIPAHDLILSSTRMHRFLEYHPEDMVVTVQSGMPVGILQERLRSRHQFLPINPSEPEHATVGGVVATGSTGSWRAAYGPVRDSVLEIRAINAWGSVVRAGVRVVKNAAGYDMPKLYTGSRGTLVFMTSVTFMARPLPDEVCHLSYTASSWEDLHERLNRVVSMPVRPAVIEVVRPDLRDELARPQAGISLHGAAEAVEWQTSAVMDVLRGPGALIGRIPEPLSLTRRDDVEITVRMKPKDTTSIVEHMTANRWRGAAAYFPAEGRISWVFGARPDSHTHIHDLRSMVEQRGGVLTIERMPRGWIGVLDPWGTPRSDAPLARAIKTSLDPNNVFPNLAPGL